MQTLIYCHGFASGATIGKAVWFQETLATDTRHVIAPDLNAPSFAKLTMTAMIEKLAQTMREQPIHHEQILIGSSLGALVILNTLDKYADLVKRVGKIILIAPAFMMFKGTTKEAKRGRLKWRILGYERIKNFAMDEEVKVHYGFVKDMKRYDHFAVTINKPTLVIHGMGDPTHEISIQWTDATPTAQLLLTNAGHRIPNTDQLLQQIRDFID